MWTPDGCVGASDEQRPIQLCKRNPLVSAECIEIGRSNPIHLPPTVELNFVPTRIMTATVIDDIAEPVSDVPLDLLNLIDVHPNRGEKRQEHQPFILDTRECFLRRTRCFLSPTSHEAARA
jgi:hypothetical protein